MSTENVTEQSVHLINRKFLDLSGIIDVSSFTDSVIEAECENGCVMVEGSELKIVDFSSQSGILKVTGVINGLYFIDTLRNKKKKNARR